MTAVGLELWGWWARRRELYAAFGKLEAEFAERFKGYVGDGLTPETRQRLYDEIWQSILVQRVPPNAQIEIHESSPNQLNVTITIPVPLDSLDVLLGI